MQRLDTVELLDDPALSDAVVAEAYSDLARTNRWLGNTRAILRRLKGSGARSVLDLGCGQGALLEEIRDTLGLSVTGFDLRPAPRASVGIVTGDAVKDPLPQADVVLAVLMVHHLSEDEIVRLIRNVSHASHRFIILDLVRHWLPLWLFRIFVAPFLSHINAADGATSVRRAYTPRELRKIVNRAVEGTSACVRHTAAPFYIRQIVDISW